jgi:hypothetical protein
VVDFSKGIDLAVIQLAGIVGMVIDVERCDRSVVVGVLGAVSSDAVILERWDASAMEPGQDPFTIDLDSIRRIVVR